MTKGEIDVYFTEKYEEIKLYIEKSFSKHKIFNENPDFFFSELYLYIVERKDEIDSEQDLRNYISTFIHNNTYWTNSSIRESENYSRLRKNVEFIPEHFENLTEDTSDLETEAKMNEYKAVIEMYYKSLTSLEKKAVWEIYFIEKKRTIQEFADYIQRSRSVADKFIKTLWKDIREYYKNYKEGLN